MIDFLYNRGGERSLRSTDWVLVHTRHVPSLKV